MELAADTIGAESHMAALEMRAQQALSSEDLEIAWFLLQRAGQEDTSGELRLNFDQFTQAGLDCQELVGPHVHMYFQPSCFLRLTRNASGCVPASMLLRHLAARSTQLRLRWQLGRLDTSGSGSLTAAQLAAFLEACAPATALSEQLVSVADWVAAVQARLMLLHAKRGRLPIKDLVAGPAMQELMQLVRLLSEADTAAAPGQQGPGALSLLLREEMQQSWAAPAAVGLLRARFSELDRDGDGLLSQQEFAGFSSGTMTPLFIARLFEQHCSASCGTRSVGGDGSSSAGMGFAAFAMFVAAWEARHHPTALRYLFPVLDVNAQGFLTQLELHTFFREVLSLWLQLGQWPDLRAEDVLAELTDLARPAAPGRITAADLERCGMGGTIVGMLADVNVFWEWENREALLTQQQEEQQAI